MTSVGEGAPIREVSPAATVSGFDHVRSSKGRADNSAR